jgi:hypothetical protein
MRNRQREALKDDDAAYLSARLMMRESMTSHRECAVRQDVIRQAYYLHAAGSKVDTQAGKNTHWFRATLTFITVFIKSRT